MNLFRTCQRLASESSERPERDREFDLAVIAATGILLAIAFWINLRSTGDDPQANSQVVSEKAVLNEMDSAGPSTMMASHLASP